MLLIYNHVDFDVFTPYKTVNETILTSAFLSSETPLAPSTPVVSNIQSTEVRLTWFPPGYDGNSPILSYNVEAKAGSNVWRLIKDDINSSDRQISILVRNLLPHTQYQFRVRAVNQVGVGAASGASGSIMTLIAGNEHLLLITLANQNRRGQFNEPIRT